MPPGNAPGETKWQGRPAARAKTEIKLTAGKAISVPIEQLIDVVVKENRVVAFVKGTRTQPQCGFSYKMLQARGPGVQGGSGGGGAAGARRLLTACAGWVHVAFIKPEGANRQSHPPACPRSLPIHRFLPPDIRPRPPYTHHTRHTPHTLTHPPQPTHTPKHAHNTPTDAPDPHRS